MESKEILPVADRRQFRRWLSENHDKEKECWVIVKRGRPVDEDRFWYLDAVEEALCFGWIDGQTGKIDGTYVQRFSPRQPNGLWTETNKERCRRLIRLGLMTEAGMEVLPDLEEPYVVDRYVRKVLENRGAWDNFSRFPELYQRVRSYNIAFYRRRDRKAYERGLDHLVETSLRNEMFGEWNDYGRLLE